MRVVILDVWKFAVLVMYEAPVNAPWCTVRLPRRDARVAVVAVSGDIDMANADEFEEALRFAVTTAPEVAVDLRAVSYCDSSGLRVLFTIASDAKLTLILKSNGPAWRLLRIPGLELLATVVVEN